MIDARCSCGALSLSLPGPSRLVVACHCLDCQRRTGAPFGVGAFYAADTVTISGMSKSYVRTAMSGDNLPGMIGVAVGAIADPDFPAPTRSVFEQSKHRWEEISGAEHVQQGSAPKKTSS